MGFYSQVIVPLLCDFGLDRPSVAKYRRELLTHAGGDVLEIGFGTGLNLPHYPKQVQKITTVDPNVGMYRRARRRISQYQRAPSRLKEGTRRPAVILNTEEYMPRGIGAAPRPSTRCRTPTRRRPTRSTPRCLCGISLSLFPQLGFAGLLRNLIARTSWRLRSSNVPRSVGMARNLPYSSKL